MHEAGPHFAGVRRESGGKTAIDAKADLPCAPFELQHGPRSIWFAGRVGRDPPQVGDRHTSGVPAINPFHAGAELAVMQMQGFDDAVMARIGYVVDDGAALWRFIFDGFRHSLPLDSYMGIHWCSFTPR